MLSRERRLVIEGDEFTMMGGYGNGYGGGYSPMMGGGSWIFAGLVLCFWFLVLVGIVLLVVWMVRGTSGHGHAGGQHHGESPFPMPSDSAQQQPSVTGHDEAVAIVRRRLASGEITPEQYAEIMRHLGG